MNPQKNIFFRRPTFRLPVLNLVLLLLLFFCARPAQAQSAEIEQLLLNVEKLAQLKSMLQDLRKGYEIVATGYGTLKDLSEGNFSLHDAFLNRLLEVSPLVKNYTRVKDIIEAELKIQEEYRAAQRTLTGSGLLTREEGQYLARVFTSLWKGSLPALEDLAMVLTAGELRMSDGERLEAIDAIWKAVQDRLVFLRHFTSEARMLVLARAREKADTETVKKLYSLK